uniref:Uncharacterized protein n=1 Tax=Timema cristinae TaxID=61476 RepID=A0A7R9CC85_TIMCR|nr:unnamed protein product [Timema cristinae]
MSHTNLRSSLCTARCCSNRSFSGYAIWHSGQQYKVEPSNAVVRRISPGRGRGGRGMYGFFLYFRFFLAWKQEGGRDILLQWIPGDLPNSATLYQLVQLPEQSKPGALSSPAGYILQT